MSDRGMEVCQDAMEVGPTSSLLPAPQPPGPSTVPYPLLSTWVHPIQVHLGLGWRVISAVRRGLLKAPHGLPKRKPAPRLPAPTPSTEISE